MVSADFKSVGSSPSTGVVGSTPSRSRLSLGRHDSHYWRIQLLIDISIPVNYGIGVVESTRNGNQLLVNEVGTLRLFF